MQMLKKAVYCERLKARGTLLWPAFLMIPIIPILQGPGNYLANLDILESEWYSLWTQVTMFFATFFFAPLIGTYCAFLWRYENFGGNRNALFARPLPLWTIYLAKLVLVWELTVLTMLWFLGLFLLAGRWAGLPMPVPGQIWLWMARGIPGAFVIAALQYLAAFLIPNFSLPIILGLLGGVTGLLGAHSRAGIFWPYSQMLLGMNSNRSEDVLGARGPLFFGVCALYLIVLTAAGIKWMKLRH